MKLLKIILVLMVVFSLAFAPAAALAAKKKGDEGPSPVRKVWDTVWLFINFFVLVFVIVKYGRKPLMDFLAEKRVEIAENLETVQDRLSSAEAEYKEAMTNLEQMQEKIGEIEEYMRQDAERNRERILEEAQEKSRIIMAEAKERAESSIKNAYARVREELIDIAINTAQKKITESLSDEDETRLVDEYLSDLSAKAQA